MKDQHHRNTKDFNYYEKLYDKLDNLEEIGTFLET